MTPYDSSAGINIVLFLSMAAVGVVYYVVGPGLRKLIATNWWWACPAAFALGSYYFFGDVAGALKTGLVATFFVGIPGAIVMSMLNGKDRGK
jgi:uncharacterized membrane protein YdcZ (DUF606 family)